MRYRNQWKGPDTFYDAWLLKEHKHRNEFDKAEFYNIYEDIRPDDDDDLDNIVDIKVPPKKKFKATTVINEVIIISDESDDE